MRRRGQDPQIDEKSPAKALSAKAASFEGGSLVPKEPDRPMESIGLDYTKFEY
ncbi:MAG TPA: hypothetical protein VJA66_00060 [Thermoanaerobaculia bacterium]